MKLMQSVAIIYAANTIWMLFFKEDNRVGIQKSLWRLDRSYSGPFKAEFFF